jgi:hypothetical protein
VPTPDPPTELSNLTDNSGTGVVSSNSSSDNITQSSDSSNNATVNATSANDQTLPVNSSTTLPVNSTTDVVAPIVNVTRQDNASTPIMNVPT